MTPEQKTAALEMITAQIAALDDILRRCSIELNFVRCKERMLQWQKDAVPLIAQQIGAKEGRQFAEVRPGPAFTNDLMEEVSDEADTFRNWLQRLAADVKKR